VVIVCGIHIVHTVIYGVVKHPGRFWLVYIGKLTHQEESHTPKSKG